MIREITITIDDGPAGPGRSVWTLYVADDGTCYPSRDGVPYETIPARQLRGPIMDLLRPLRKVDPDGM